MGRSHFSSSVKTFAEKQVTTSEEMCHKKMGRYWLKVSYERNGCYRSREIFVKRGVEDLFEAFKSLMLDKYYKNKLRTYTTAYGRDSNLLLSMEVLYSASDKTCDRTPITCRRYYIVNQYDNLEHLPFNSYDDMSKKLKSIFEYLHVDMQSSYRKRQVKKKFERRHEQYNKLIETKPQLWTGEIKPEDDETTVQENFKILPEHADLLLSPFEENYKSKPTSPPLGDEKEQSCTSPVFNEEEEQNLSPLLVMPSTALVSNGDVESSMETTELLPSDCNVEKEDPNVNIFFK